MKHFIEDKKINTLTIFTDEQEDEDAIVNRISACLFNKLMTLFTELFLSTFTLAVSAGAVLLLPFSIISNEILLSFPQNYYIQWLNGSLIHGLWNLAPLFSNLCLFVLMPFAFFFLESEGFAGLKKTKVQGEKQLEEGHKKGIRARILETLVMLVLLALLILGMVWVASALVDKDAASMESLYDLWEFYLPYLYSCISRTGCLLLLLCTPVGLSRMFTVMGQLLVKPTALFWGWGPSGEEARSLLTWGWPEQRSNEDFTSLARVSDQVTAPGVPTPASQTRLKVDKQTMDVGIRDLYLKHCIRVDPQTPLYGFCCK
ncbi:limb region 1 protein homolog [Zalophus californianus]|uniref:Limb region 1 protein homolog n=1 Tax=Zalophus californianus TaxID=9704 RepID=A0A6P9FHZ7_ZALCA|nr:limb region 1 protein homolog [Zalophus californianus]